MPLSYRSITRTLTGLVGVEPDDLSVDSAAATPLAHSPGKLLTGRIGFEPTISRLRAERVNRLHQRPIISMRPAGFEPATSRLSTVRCCRLSYRRKTGMRGFEPRQIASKTTVLPVRRHPNNLKAPGRARTGDILFHRQEPLPTGLQAPSCSRRDSNSDHALIRRLQVISLPLFQLSYGSESAPRVGSPLIPQLVLPPGLEPGPCADLALTRHHRAALPN